MFLILKNILLKIINFVFLAIIYLIILILNIGIFIISGGTSYGDFSGDTCIEYLSYNFDTNLVDKDYEITCHIESVFPVFLSQYSFRYKVQDNYKDNILSFGLSEIECDKELTCYSGFYRDGFHRIEFNREKSDVSLHEISF